MRWLKQSLNRKFAAGTAAGLVMSSLFFLALFIGLYRGQLERERSETATHVSRLFQTALENLMLKRDLEGLKEVVKRLGEGPGIVAVRIANPAGEVRFASDDRELGTQVPGMADPGDGPSTWISEGAGGRSLLHSVHPIPNQPRCLECHGPVDQKPINGILYLDFDAAPIRDKARATTLLLMGSGALIVLINIAGGWWFMRRYVLTPVGHLADSSRRLAEGDLETRIRLPGEDQLATLGQRFNQMAESLQGKLRELARKETFLQGLVDAIPDGIRVIDQEYQVLISNAAYRKQHGWGDSLSPPQSVPPPNLCYAATHGRDSPCPETLTLCPLKEVSESGQPLRTVQRHQRSDGSSLDVEIYAAPMQITDNGTTRRLVVESIRDLNQEVRFSHEQRLSELGRLAAGVAHEIHNPLAAVRMALDAAARACQSPGTDPTEVTRLLDLVDREVENCIEVTERLLKLSMPPPTQPELVAVEHVIAETLKLLAWETETQGVTTELSVERPPLRVLATDSDLRMLTLNLAQNACHAMPEGGSLRVRCRRAEGRVRIDFEDTGVGIGPNDQGRIFEPFFSRRADGVRGTGLGLSITKAIVEGHGGTIEVQSRPGEGSRFRVTFPMRTFQPEGLEAMAQEILVVEDDATLNQLIVAQLNRLDYAATGARSWREADAYLQSHEPHLIIGDVRIADGDTLVRLTDLAKMQPVVVLTAYGSVRDAVSAVKAGAYEYLVKPVNPDELALVVKRAIDDAALRNDHGFCRRRLKAKEGKGDFMVGVSAALLKTKETIAAVGPSDINVLIQGESGSGKELVARAIHDSSDRTGRNFVPVDCCTLQEKLFESELFGHEKGAFTGADRLKRGLIEGAEGGTLFLDEIGEIDPSIQAKLLRVLETGIFRRVGGTKDLPANTRVVAATNRDLEALSREGQFRSDLYYRLSTFVIQVPPLRERRDDIPYLAAHFIQNHNFSRRINTGITGEAIRHLTAYDWPGNVRELKNVIERAIILSRDGSTIRPEHLTFGAGGGKCNARVTLSFDHDPSLEELQAEYLRLQLGKYSGHRAKVAEVLAVSERNIYRLIQRYGLKEAQA